MSAGNDLPSDLVTDCCKVLTTKVDGGGVNTQMCENQIGLIENVVISSLVRFTSNFGRRGCCVSVLAPHYRLSGTVATRDEMSGRNLCPRPCTDIRRRDHFSYE